jgi:Fic family protein
MDQIHLKYVCVFVYLRINTYIMGQKIYNFEVDIDMKLLGVLSQLDRFDSSWIAIEKRVGASLKELKSIATVRSVGASTRIEGSKMTDDEVEVLIDKLKITSLEERDQQEVAGYYIALDTISENYLNIDITENQIKSLHKILMQYSEKDSWHRGDYKQMSNAVEASSSDGTNQLIFKTAEPGFQTQNAMANLFAWYQSDSLTIPLIKIAIFIYEFLSIHPFQDGNGRLSRLLGTLLLMKQGYSWIQYVSFEHEIEHRKTEYYKVLMQTQRNRPNENVTEWFQFFSSCMINIQNQLMSKIQNNKKEIPLSHRENRLFSFIQSHPGCTSGDIAKKLDIPSPTVKRTLSDLMNKGILSKEGQGKATRYSIA